jgi:hypothetical protein
VIADVPVDPDAPTAQQWLARELSGAPYQQAKPGPIEDLVNRVVDWLSTLVRARSGGGAFDIPDLSGLLPAILVVLVLGLLVVAFLVFGVPRLNRRSKARTGELFEDDRDADTLRRDARRSAASGDYATAVAELFRALARRLDERAVVSSFPGTTARGFASRAGAAFPDAAERLAVCARDFDAVRYLEEPGTAEQWARIEALEAELHDARPRHAESLDEFAESLR